MVSKSASIDPLLQNWMNGIRLRQARSYPVAGCQLPEMPSEVLDSTRKFIKKFHFSCCKTCISVMPLTQFHKMTLLPHSVTISYPPLTYCIKIIRAKSLKSSLKKLSSRSLTELFLVRFMQSSRSLKWIIRENTFFFCFSQVSPTMKSTSVLRELFSIKLNKSFSIKQWQFAFICNKTHFSWFYALLSIC